MRVELTPSGYLILDAETSASCFADAPSALVAVRGRELWVVALADGAVGGLILKQRNARGDRSVLVIEQLIGEDWEAGEREAWWDWDERALRVPLCAAVASGGAG